MVLFCSFYGFCSKAIKTSITTNDKLSKTIGDYMHINSSVK